MHNLDVTLTTPLLQLPGIGAYIDDQLKRADIRTVGDLLREASTKSHHASWSHDWLNALCRNRRAGKRVFRRKGGFEFVYTIRASNTRAGQMLRCTIAEFWSDAQHKSGPS
jgi:hypothetical protein